jgi:Subtilase family
MSARNTALLGACAYFVSCPPLFAQQVPPAAAGRYAVLLRDDGEAHTRFLERMGELRRARVPAALEQHIAVRRQELGSGQDPIVELAASRGATLVGRGWLLDLVVLDGVSSDLRAELSAHAEVLDVQPIEYRAPALKKALDAAHHDVHAVHALSVGGAALEGSGQSIAILDTGLDMNMGGSGRPHAAFFANGDPLDPAGGGIGGSRVLSTSFATHAGQTVTAEDLHGHGTRMASCAAGAAWSTLPDVGDGAAPAAGIRVFKISSDSPQFFGLTSADSLFFQLQKVVQQSDVFVANLSYDGWLDPTYFINPTLDAAVLSGVSLTVSAGNYGTNLNFAHGCYNPLVVGGSEEANYKPALFPFVSAVGPLPDGRRYPHLIAQGQYVACAKMDVESAAVDSNGCSGAAAITSGTLALLFQADPTLTPLEAKALLLNTTAKTIGNPNASGWGYLKGLAAVQAAQANQVVREQVQQGDLKRYPVVLSAGVERSFTLTWERTDVYMSFPAQSGFVADLDLELVDVATDQVLLASSSSVNLVEQLRFTWPTDLQAELRVRATQAETGQEFTGYALAGVDAIAIDDGSGCSGAGIAISSTTPAVVPSLADGANVLTLHGCNLVPLPTVKFNGVPTSAVWVDFDSHALSFALPPLTVLGPLTLELTNPNGTASITVQVVAPQPLIRFALASTVVFPFLEGLPYNPYVAGTPGDVAFVAIAGSLVPSTIPGIVDLSIGNGFFDFLVLTAQIVPASGWFQPTYSFGPGLPAGFPVHFQAAYYSPSTGALPLVVSNVASGTVL